jgi:predicted metalloendopeptidase
MNRWSRQLVFCAALAAAPPVMATGPDQGNSGIQTQYIDSSVRPQDDFYRYVNGKWLASTEIPPDRPACGTATKLFDDSQRQLREVVEAVAKNTTAAPGSNEFKIGTLYNSFLDVSRIERLGSTPLAGEFARIKTLRSIHEIPALIAHLQNIGVIVPFDVSVHLDSKDSRRYVVDLQQDGLGLPDRDYYVRDDATALRLIRHQYQAFIASSLSRLGDQNARQEAAAIVALETELARSQWSRTDNLDPNKVYNKVRFADLGSIAAGCDWRRYFAAAGINGKEGYLIVNQPSYLHEFARLLTHTPLSTWKVYFRWHVLSGFAPYLSQPYVDGAFSFYSTAIQGVPENQPRWKRGLMLVDQSIGEALGRLYVEKYFLQQSKSRAQLLVRNLLQAYRQDIGMMDWMGPDTKAQALLKLSRITIKIGYPDEWRDYAALQFREDDLVGNVMRAMSFEFQRNINKLGRPVDRTEWETTPQDVNASYNPQMNEIVFPAAILQPPFFDVTADDAANYGAIGMVIGHEISHAFDDRGSQYDGDGNLRDWWTAEDRSRFDARTRPLIAEYSAFMPIRGRHLNGELTLNENIADNAGLAIAYKAYHLSLNGNTAPVIDGMSGDQRFYMAFAQAWREKIRDVFAIELIQSDPHAISYDRVIGTLVNQAGFYQTFGVKPGDKMYLPPDQRVVIW